MACVRVVVVLSGKVSLELGGRDQRREARQADKSAVEVTGKDKDLLISTRKKHIVSISLTLS